MANELRSAENIPFSRRRDVDQWSGRSFGHYTACHKPIHKKARV